VFLWRRFTRIAPLYWLAVTLRVAKLEYAPEGAPGTLLTPWRILASYLFIPAKNGAGEIFPVVTAGWTLNYEAFFYLLFAAALALDVSPLAFLTPCLTAVAMAGIARTAAWPDFTSLASPVVLEFLLGVMLAHLAARRKLPGKAGGAALLGGGLLALMLTPEGYWHSGLLAWGLPAAVVVTGAVALEESLGQRLPRWLLEAGDASYALYLSHTFVLAFVVDGVAALHMTGAPALAAMIGLGLGVGFPVAVLAHRYVEAPLMGLLKKRPELVMEAPAALAVAAEG
jgi:peptidoglycan/LPS O-acetylase OafA/YrhL